MLAELAEGVKPPPERATKCEGACMSCESTEGACSCLAPFIFFHFTVFTISEVNLTQAPFGPHFPQPTGDISESSLRINTKMGEQLFNIL